MLFEFMHRLFHVTLELFELFLVFAEPLVTMVQCAAEGMVDFVRSTVLTVPPTAGCDADSLRHMSHAGLLQVMNRCT